MLLPLSIPQPGARNYVWRFILLLRTGSRGICCCFRHSTSGVQLTTLLRNYKGLTSLLPVQNCVFTLIVKLSKSKELYVEKKNISYCVNLHSGAEEPPPASQHNTIRICFTYSSILSSNLVSYHLPVPKYNVFSNLTKTYTFVSKIAVFYNKKVHNIKSQLLSLNMYVIH